MATQKMIPMKSADKAFKPCAACKAPAKCKAAGQCMAKKGK